MLPTSARVLVAFLPLLCAAFSQTGADSPYVWFPAGPLQTARSGACATALLDGRIMVAGGLGASGALRSVEFYQSDGTFTSAPDMTAARFGHTCTTLADGRVFVAGGYPDGSGVVAETFDPSLNTWAAAELGSARWNQTATPLPDGRVLLAGGEDANGITNLLEWFDPRTNRIRALPNRLSEVRNLHASALLPDGSVLVSGGWNGQRLLDAVEIVKADGIVQSAPAMPEARAGHSATALGNGCVLIAGGLGDSGDLTSAVQFCADAGVFRASGNMAVSRYLHLAVFLPGNGRVLIAGGFSQGEATPTSELYDPDTNAFIPAGALTLARLGIAAAADPTTGSVLAVGGMTGDSPVAACGVLRGPTINFDKTRYLDGDSVTVSGLGWTPGATVNLSLALQPFGQPGPGSTSTFQPVASALGRIQQTLQVASASQAGVTFKITAAETKSGLTAGNSAVQISRATVSLKANPANALTRQPVLLQAVIIPATKLDALDGSAAFAVNANPVGTVTSTGQITRIGGGTGDIIDGTSNTLLLGESLPLEATGFSTNFTPADGGFRPAGAAGAFQLVTRDIPAGGNVLTLSGASAAYSPSVSLYAPNAGTAQVNVQKRAVQVSLSRTIATAAPKVGDTVTFFVAASPTQIPMADVPPTGAAHITGLPGTAVDTSPLAPLTLSLASGASFSITPPAGTFPIAAQYAGDSVFLPGLSNTSSLTVAKGSLGFSLIPGKTVYTVGEPISLTARITHPKVIGATPAGQISRIGGPVQFQGATVGLDPQNSGAIQTVLPVAGTPAPGNFTVTMSYSGDANFNGASAGAVLTISKAQPQISLIPPAQILAGQVATFVIRAAAPTGLTVAAPSGTIALVGGPSTTLVAGGLSSTATLRQTFPSAGTFSVMVQYSGDTNYLAVTSAPIQVVVQ